MDHLFQHRIRLSRAACIAGALVCFASAYVLTPAGARSQLAPQAPALLPTATPIQPQLHPVAPARDAFAPRAQVDDDPPTAQVQPVQSLQLPVARIPVTAPLRASDAIRVSALATGEHPIAIVEFAGNTHTLTRGDALGGSTIAAIERDGIVLASGRRLALAPAGPLP
jgi:hypothetical protein